MAFLNRPETNIEPRNEIGSSVRRAAVLAGGHTRLRILLVLGALTCAWTVAKPQSEPLTEYQIKASFLFNFTKFVEWPLEVFPDASAPIVMGVVGGDQVTNLLEETAAGKTVNGRSVVVKRFKPEQVVRGCQILFIGASEQKHALQILEGIRGSSILTVGEAKGFAQSGGVINFLVEGNRVRLELNLDAAARARLKISAKVIAVARLVKVDIPPGGRT